MKEEKKAEEAEENVLADSFEDLPEDDGTYEPSGKEKSAEVKEEPEEPAETKPAAKVPVSIQVLVNGRSIRLSGKSSYVFVDVFDYIDFDLQSVKGTKLITDLNGHKAEYMEPIANGDQIVIRWEK